eukprot:scaffold358_cov256-Pinguiococcus_pyrenoidosus.AAC.23
MDRGGKLVPSAKPILPNVSRPEGGCARQGRAAQAMDPQQAVGTADATAPATAPASAESQVCVFVLVVPPACET